MLKFKNKMGKEVMEMTDAGELKIDDKKLEESFKEKKTSVKETDEKK